MSIEVIKSLANKEITINQLTQKECSIEYDKLKTSILINDKRLEAIVDNGANISIIEYSLATHLNIPINLSEKTELKMANGGVSISSGTIQYVQI